MGFLRRRKSKSAEPAAAAAEPDVSGASGIEEELDGKKQLFMDGHGVLRFRRVSEREYAAINRPVAQQKPLVVAVVGAPGCGKSTVARAWTKTQQADPERACPTAGVAVYRSQLLELWELGVTGSGEREAVLEHASAVLLVASLADEDVEGRVRRGLVELDGHEHVQVALTHGDAPARWQTSLQRMRRIAPGLAVHPWKGSSALEQFAADVAADVAAREAAEAAAAMAAVEKWKKAREEREARRLASLEALGGGPPRSSAGAGNGSMGAAAAAAAKWKRKRRSATSTSQES